jgi:hypothetical protein
VNELELFVDCLRRLREADATYMVTGSIASNLWGIPRSRLDLDGEFPIPSKTC